MWIARKPPIILGFALMVSLLLGGGAFWWHTEFTAVDKVPLEYALTRIESVRGYYFPRGGERLAFDNRAKWIVLGYLPEMPTELHEVTSFYQGKPPPVKYDFYFSTECSFAPRLTKRPNLFYSSDTGILYVVGHKNQWCVVPPKFREHMLMLRNSLPKDPIKTPKFILHPDLQSAGLD
jgi:hypothetical protein